MNFNVKELGMGVYLLEPIYKEDNRGISFVTFSTPDFRQLGLNFSISYDLHYIYKSKNILRGIHFQNEPLTQVKMIRCTKGKILDYVIDLRKKSSTYLKWICVELNPENKYQLIIPKGFGQAFVTLEDDTEIVYKTDQKYESILEKTIRWNDPTINIKWPIEDPILSEKDANAPLLNDCECNF